jgi:ABC-2 type transport system permease protein
MEQRKRFRTLRFLAALWKANLLASMEYRASFLTQIVGMILNDAFYFVFWIIFFDRFKSVHGWNLSDMFITFGVAAASFGLGSFLFGNVMSLSDVITGGRLDYYLSLPQPVLLHVMASNAIPSGLGDVIYGCISFLLARQLTPDAAARFVLAVLLATIVFVSFMVVVHSLSFWMGNAQLLSRQATNAMVTFALYPTTLFDNTAKILLLTLVPAGVMGAVPAEFVRSFTVERLLELLVGAVVFLFLAFFLFYRGLRRYESGSAIQTQV